MGYVNKVNDGNGTHLIEPTLYTTCSTDASTATKQTAAIDSFSLVSGVQVTVKFTTTNTAAVSGLKLQIGSDTNTAKPIKYRGANLPAKGTLAANRVYTFVYDGTNWELIGDLDTNTQSNYGNITTAGKIGTTADLAVYTTTDGLVTAGTLATDDPTAATTTSTTFIDTISQDSKGKISATKKTLPTASTSTAGIIQIGTGATNAAAGNHNHNIDDLTNINRVWRFYGGTILANGTDFNTIKTIGNYYNTTNDNTTNNTNAPIGNSAFTLKVVSSSGGSTNKIRQIYQKYTSPLQFERYSSSEDSETPTWSSWYYRPFTTAAAGTKVGDTNQPIYINTDGSITAGTALSEGAYKDIKNNTSAGSLEWNSGGSSNAENLKLVNVNTLAYWDGTYYSSNHASNLAYYSGGAFGTMAAENKKNYPMLAGNNTFTGTNTFNSTVTVPTPSNDTDAATKAYVDGILATNNAMIFKGTLNGATPTGYTPAADCGWTYKVATAGLINGERVEVGDVLICTTDSTAEATSSNVSTVKANWVIIQNNVDGALFMSTNTFTSDRILVSDGTNGKVKVSEFTPDTIRVEIVHWDQL